MGLLQAIDEVLQGTHQAGELVEGGLLFHLVPGREVGGRHLLHGAEQVGLGIGELEVEIAEEEIADDGGDGGGERRGHAVDDQSHATHVHRVLQQVGSADERDGEGDDGAEDPGEDENVAHVLGKAGTGALAGEQGAGQGALVDGCCRFEQAFHGANAVCDDGAVRYAVERIVLGEFVIADEAGQRGFLAHVAEEGGDHAQQPEGEDHQDGSVDQPTQGGELVLEVDRLEQIELPVDGSPQGGCRQYHQQQGVAAEMRTKRDDLQAS